jgi:hypothetical protein
MKCRKCDLDYSTINYQSECYNLVTKVAKVRRSSGRPTRSNQSVFCADSVAQSCYKGISAVAFQPDRLAHIEKLE